MFLPMSVVKSQSLDDEVIWKTVQFFLEILTVLHLKP